jgi:hypothetical protein
MPVLRTIALLAFLATLITGCSKQTKGSALTQGRDSLLAGEWDQAIEQLSLAIQADPLDTEARVLRGRAYMCRGRENAPLAIADYNEAIRLNPDDYEAYYNRAIAFRQKGDRRQALADEMHARRLDPTALRAGAMQPESLDDFRRATGRAPDEDFGASKKEKEGDQEDPTAPSIENMPVPQRRDPAKSAAELGKNTLQKPGASDSTPLRDAYGIPLGAPSSRTGSITEEILGLTNRADPPRRNFGGDRDWSDRPARPNWQANSPPQSAPLPASPRNLPKESPIGKLPQWGLPFQQPGHSPYSPYGQNRPSTGLRSNPQGEVPGYGPRYTPYNQPFTPVPRLPDERY